jgi:hypothetical protein
VLAEYADCDRGGLQVGPVGVGPPVYHLVYPHNAEVATDQQLQLMWLGKSPEEVYNILSQPDVMVTNQSDKDTQLPKLLRLNARGCLNSCRA